MNRAANSALNRTRTLSRTVPYAALLSVSLLLGGCSGDGSSDSTGSSGITGAVFFGDSLTDAGTTGVRYTTMPGQTWAQLLAAQYGQPTTPAAEGGTNYAVGGARVALPDPPDGQPDPVSVQIDTYLAGQDSIADGQLFTVFAGTNDVLQAQGAPEGSPDITAVTDAADAEIDQVGRLLDAGADHVLVLTLYDLAYAPAFGGDSQDMRNRMSGLTDIYNDRLTEGLQDRFGGDDRTGVFDTRSVLDGIVTDLPGNGFTHGISEDACAVPGVATCDADSLVAPDADRNYVFAGGVHLTTHTNELLAAAVEARVGELWGASGGGT